MNDDDLQSQIDGARRNVASVISSMSSATTSRFEDRRTGRTDASDDACAAVLFGVSYGPDPDTEPDADSESDTEADRRPLVRAAVRHPDPDADLRPVAEAVSAEAELDVLDQVRQLAEAVDLSLALGARLLRRARPAASVVVVVSALLVLTGCLIGAVATLSGCLLVLR